MISNNQFRDVLLDLFERHKYLVNAKDYIYRTSELCVREGKKGRKKKVQHSFYIGFILRTEEKKMSR